MGLPGGLVDKLSGFWIEKSQPQPVRLAIMLSQDPEKPLTGWK